MTGFLMVALNELRTLHEHAARTAGRVVDTPLEGLQDLYDQTHDRIRGEVLATTLSFLGGEVGEKIFVDESESIALKLSRQWRKQAKELDKSRAFELLVPAWQDVLELWVGLLDGFDGCIGRLTDVLTFWQVYQVGQARLVRHMEHGLRLVVRGVSRVTARSASLSRSTVSGHS